MTVKVQPADFCVIPAHGPVGPVIASAEWLQRTVQEHKLHALQKYEHAEIWVGDPSGQYPYGVTFSAYPNSNGMRVLDCPPEQLPGALWSSGAIDLTPQQRAGIVEWCYSHGHVSYAALDYVALTAHTLGIRTQELQDFIQSQKSMICSQYTDAAYMANGVQLFTGRWQGFVTPLDLALKLESLGVRPIA